jgi:hypothetical protein
MSYKLLLELPQNVYEPLVKTAAQIGKTPEELAISWLSAAIQQCIDDPLEKFIGAFPSNGSDWADQHDQYLGRTLIDKNDPK